MSLSIVIMAAGKGTRMKSSRPKVLHKLAGRPMLSHVIASTSGLNAAQQVVITGHGAEMVEAAMTTEFAQAPLQFVRQEPQLGTGHAVQQAVPVLPDDGITLILNGDTPLIHASTAQALVDACAGDQLALLTIRLDDPTGYGRIVRDETGVKVLAIVEHKDATPEQRAISEVYTGMMAAPTARLKHWLSKLNNDNAQGEYYLTDVVAMAQAEGLSVVAAQPRDEVEVLGVNSPAQLAELERRHQRVQAERLMEQGVRLADPARFDLRGTLQCGQDVDIDVNCIFEGKVVLGDEVQIGANCVIRNATIARGAVIHPFTHIDGDNLGAHVGEGSLIGPFARLRPGA